MRYPQRVIDRFKFAAVAVFVGVMGSAGVYWAFWQRPAERCEASGNWWDPQSRVCGTVIYIPDLTGRYQIDGREWRPEVAGQRTTPTPSNTTTPTT